jgi:hypothetical protein
MAIDSAVVVAMSITKQNFNFPDFIIYGVTYTRNVLGTVYTRTLGAGTYLRSILGTAYTRVVDGVNYLRSVLGGQ